MSLAIYRKYRPQTWADLTNQNHIKVTLQNEIEAGKITHAYLFTGPRGVGKTTTARLFAKAINCEDKKDKQSEPCNKCNACQELVIGNDLDVLEIDAASHTGVDNVRENIIANARFTPMKRKYKIFIIDEVHMLSISAFNALLKTLEEPPEHAIFILATTEVHKVPATIISRCQRFDFKKINSEELIKRLSKICQQEGIKVDKQVLSDIARVSEGSLRDAESLLGQILSLGEKEISREEASLIIPTTNYNLVLELINNLVYKNIEASIILINKLFDEGIDLIQFTDELIEFLRKLILTKISGSLKEFAFDLDESMEKSIIDLAQKFEVGELVRLVNVFVAKKIEIKSATILQLPLEIAIIEYCNSKKDVGEENDEEDKGNDVSDSHGELDSAKKDEQVIKAEIMKKESTLLKSFKKQDEVKGSGPPSHKASSSANATEDKSEDKLNQEDVGGSDSATFKKSKEIKITISQIKDKWHDFLVELQKQNTSLVFILKVAEPLELKGNILEIGFKYDFHKQRVEQAKVKEVIEKVLAEFFKENLAITASLLAKDYESDFIKEQTQQDEVELIDELPASEEESEQKELIDTLVKIFDGKIVE